MHHNANEWNTIRRTENIQVQVLLKCLVCDILTNLRQVLTYVPLRSVDQLAAARMAYPPTKRGSKS